MEDKQLLGTFRVNELLNRKIKSYRKFLDKVKYHKETQIMTFSYQMAGKEWKGEFYVPENKLYLEQGNCMIIPGSRYISRVLGPRIQGEVIRVSEDEFIFE